MQNPNITKQKQKKQQTHIWGNPGGLLIILNMFSLAWQDSETADKKTT